MAAEAYIHSRVTAETKALLHQRALQQGISEAVVIRQVLSAVLGTAPVESPQSDMAQPHDNRFYVRLAIEDARLLRERSAARGMPPGTYLATLTRAHLRQIVPVPKDELNALKRAVAELGAIGRNLNQIARAANQGVRGISIGRPEFTAMLKVAEGLRDHIKALVNANNASWRSHA